MDSVAVSRDLLPLLPHRVRPVHTQENSVMSEREIVPTGTESSRLPAVSTRHHFTEHEVPARIWELLGILETCQPIKKRLEERRSNAAKIEVECQGRLAADPARPSKEQLELPFALSDINP